MSEPRSVSPRRLAWIGAALVGVALVAVALVRDVRTREAAREAFPTHDGRVALPLLSAEVTVFRDVRGVPHAEAANAADALFALGYAHAQDRLTQMLWLRRRAQGRAAEVLGEEALEADRMARLVGFARLAEAQLPRLAGRTRAALAAYAAGASARIERIRQGQEARPVAADDLDLPLDAWRPVDSLAVFKLYAWLLGESVEASLVLDDMIREVGSDAAARFFPGGGGLGGPTVPAERAGPAADGAAPVLLARPGALRRAAGFDAFAVGSSAWVLGGSHSESGWPLLAVDHHLPTSVPAWLYLAHVRGGDLDVAGATLPGVPVFWSGQNGRVAWGAVAAAAVVTDLYKERLHDDGSDRHYDGRRYRDLSVRQETIEVRGAAPVELTVRATRHGPLIATDGVDALAVSWTGARTGGPSGIGSLLDLARADDALELVEALADHHEPVLSVVYVDRDGAAGMQVAGWIPQRTLSRGLVPLDGRAPIYRWTDRVPFDALPSARLLDGEGWVVAADASPAARARAPIDWLWHPGARAARLHDLLARAVREGPVGLRRFAGIQVDVGAARDRRIVDAIETLVAVSDEPLGPQAAEITDALFDWDGRATADSRGAAAYHALLGPLYEGLLVDALGEELWRRYLALPRSDGETLLHDLLKAAAADATVGGERVEAVAAVVRDSLRKAWLRLYDLGPNRQRWTWGRLHPIRFRGFDGLSARVGGWELEPHPYPGGPHTVLAAAYDPLDPFAVRIASTARLAFDAGSLGESLVSLAPGQSEHPGHRHFQDQLEPWLEGRSGLLATGALLVEETRVSRLVLEPVD
ncbi:MAG: penicillin acylase family protein [Myxococcota bacterium]